MTVTEYIKFTSLKIYYDHPRMAKVGF